MNGRLGFLRRAGDAAINVQKEQSDYALHQLRSDLRLVFYELLLAQQREAVILKGLSDLKELVRVLGERAAEGQAGQGAVEVPGLEVQQAGHDHHHDRHDQAAAEEVEFAQLTGAAVDADRGGDAEAHAHDE